MSEHSAEFRRCLEECDTGGIRRLWKYVSPHLHQPTSDLEALTTIHYARTTAQWMELKLRAYSHRWLCERSLPSALPDELRPKAERMYPVRASSVGISVNFKSPYLKPAGVIVRGAMENAVLDAYADGRKDPAFVKARMAEAKDKTLKQLFGHLDPGGTGG